MMVAAGVLGKLVGLAHALASHGTNGNSPYSIACILPSSERLLRAASDLQGLLGPKKGGVVITYARLSVGGHYYLAPYIEVVNRGFWAHATAALVPEYGVNDECIRETGVLEIKVICFDLFHVFPNINSPASMLEKVAASCGYVVMKEA